MVIRQPVYLVVGVPCAGKSWVCEQLRDLYTYVRHDDFMAYPPSTYVEAIMRNAEGGHKPVLAETPFSMSAIMEPLRAGNYHVVPVFIIESTEVLEQRYAVRERKPFPAGHASRQKTYRKRAVDGGHYFAPSAEVLMHLKRKMQNVEPLVKWPWE